ncbi:CDP-glycerol glycerophosphotransferase family protein [Paeniglutamicibacter gangotriensis]|uniref:bifunctional glycosyltransferase/CDP-glycerol:glycerophosphate glycerophosphotransferase n=1 Tax=Paeniglutamicibacter gangotriensis TaxID=254787 RepID=UPI0037C82CB9
MDKYLFTIIMAVYNVEEYIEGTLRSLEKQSYPFDKIQLVMIDDGSTDESGTIATRWAEDRQNVILINQENAGPGAARKFGLEHATGTWVTVVDPDDVIGLDYFENIARFLERDTYAKASMLITRIILMNGSTGSLSDKHPLGFRFDAGSRMVSLNEEPTCIQLGATAVLRREVLVKHGLTYDPRIEPTFEDAHLLGRYLATFEDPIVGLVADAKYFYRKRHDQSSLVQSGWSEVTRYSNVLEFGYLDLFSSIKSRLGHVPVWAQNMVLYDLFWYFKEDSSMNSKTSWVKGGLRDEFLDVLSRIFTFIDDSTIENFSINQNWWSLRETLLSFFKGKQSNSNIIYQWGANSEAGGNKYTMLYSGLRPDLDLFVNGALRSPSKENYTNHVFYGISMLTEYSFTVSEPGSIRLLINGVKAQINRSSNPTRPSVALSSRSDLALQEPRERTSGAIQRIGSKVSVLPGVNKSILNRRIGKVERVVNRIRIASMAFAKNPTAVVYEAAHRKIVSRHGMKRSQTDILRQLDVVRDASLLENRLKFLNSWLVMDRPDKADDNGEHFYRYLLNNHPEINAFFLLNKNSTDWERLCTEGFRLIEYGSDESIALTVNARLRISSDAVAEVMYPIGRRLFDYRGSDFIFLQHGVIKDDLSKWLNPKEIRAIITSTHGEYESFVGKDSPYTYTDREVLLTGLARHDALAELKLSSADQSKFLMVMPTWRQGLRDSLRGAVTPLDQREVFMSTAFGERWMSFLGSQELHATAERHGLQIVFVAHPSLSPFIDSLEMPRHVMLSTDMSVGFQDILARSEMFVTDYSSVAFDAAYLDIPVLYYQFDYEEFFASHSYREGYFDYAVDGFGPVCEEPSMVYDSIDELLLDENESESLLRYRERAFAAFAFRDGQNCRRIFDQLLEISES